MTAIDKNTPLVSVVMPMHNASKYLREAMDSILNQTYANLEFIIINDNSNDDSVVIAQSYKDKRIQLFNFNEKQGLARALNKGIEMAKGDFIARMDADDISLPERIERQVDFMLQHKEVGILGTQIIAIGNKARPLPITHHDIKWHILNACPFLHPSVMFRTRDIKQHNLYYNPEYYGAEDLELWSRASFHTGLANLDKAYVKYRYHQGMHLNMLDIVATLNTQIKINHLEGLLPTVPDSIRQKLALLMNRHLKHNRNVTWWENMIALFDETINQNPQYQKELITEFNKCIWFHLSSEPKQFAVMKKILFQHSWIKLSFKQKLWLVIKPIIQ